jgi:hypothetical protein
MTGSSDSTAGGGASTGSTVMGDFFDDFERPDGNQIGNGWIEKRPTTWALDQGSVVFESDALNYQDNIVYRPENEDVLDTEVSIDFTLLTWDSNTHPQVHARLQHDDLDVPGSVTCYILFITSGPVLSITRQIAGTFDGQWSVPLTNPLQEGDTYRLELRVTGQGPVELQGVLLHRLNGNFVEDTTIVRSDSDANMVTGAGSVGFSGSVSPEHYTYDNFSRIDLGTN